MKIAKPEDAWSTPLDAPTYPRFPITFRDCELLTLQYRTDVSAIESLVPEPLVPTGDVVLLHIARWGDVPGIGADIHECNVMVGAQFNGPNGTVTGSYSPYFFIDSDSGLVSGREINGQPKRLAEIVLENRGGIHAGTVSANGITVLTGTLPYKQKRAKIEDLRLNVDMVTNINLKILPHVDGRVAVRQLVARTLTDVNVLECWTGPCTVEIRPNAIAPLFRLPPREFLEGYYWRCEFVSAGGQILYDYMKET